MAKATSNGLSRLQDWWDRNDHSALEQSAPQLFALLKWLFTGAEGERPAIEGLAPRPAEETGAAGENPPPAGTEPAASDAADPPAALLPPIATSAITAADGRNYTIMHLGPGDRLVIDTDRMEIVLPSQMPFLDVAAAGPEQVALSGEWTDGASLGGVAGAIGWLDLAAGSSYDLRAEDANVAAGGTTVVNGAGLGSDDRIVFDGSAELDGAFSFEGGAGADSIIGGAGADTIRGGLGADSLIGGPGADIFLYGAPADSTGAGYDSLGDFDPQEDRIALPGEVSGFAAAVTAGALSAATIDEGLAAAAAGLGVGQALLFTPDDGDLAGKAFLIVNANGEAGYQAGEDFVFHLAGPAPLDALTTDIFL